MELAEREGYKVIGENGDLSVTLLNKPDLTIAEMAIRKSHDNMDKSDMVTTEDGRRIIGEKGIALIERVGVKLRHESVLEHIVFSFDIVGISRALLQELARHRMASLTVKSSRYTLTELRKEEAFVTKTEVTNGQGVSGMAVKCDYKNASKYIRLSPEEFIRSMQVESLQNLLVLVKHSDCSIDEVKYAIPECYRTSLVLTINARSLRNMFKLRTHKTALFEFRELMQYIRKAIPEEYLFLFNTEETE